MESRSDRAIGDAYVRLQRRSLELSAVVAEAVGLMKAARGHYGIEEASGPGQPATEWDEIADQMQAFVHRYGG